MPSFVNIYNRGVKEPTMQASPRSRTMSAPDSLSTPAGLIVTNSHVVKDAYSLFVTLTDGTHVPAQLLGKLLIFDLALLKIDVGRPLKPAVLGDSDKLRLGDRAVAIGNPLGFANSVSSGVISAFHRQVGLSNYDDLMQTDATINQGNSGGPLFNMDGEVIGVNQAIYTRNSGGSIGIGFSIPSTPRRKVLASIKQYGKPRVGWLGLTGQSFTPEMADVAKTPVKEGVIVADLAKGWRCCRRRHQGWRHYSEGRRPQRSTARRPSTSWWRFHWARHCHSKSCVAERRSPCRSRSRNGRRRSGPTQ